MLTKQTGFTLIEILVGLLLSTLLLGGVVQVYLSTKSTANFTRGLARLQDSASYSLELMSKDIRMAGFIPCGYPENFANEVNGSTNQWWTNLHTRPLQGYEGGSASLPGFITSLDATRVETSDVLVVMRGGRNLTSIDFYNNATNEFTTQRAMTDSWDEDGSLMVACDQRKAVLFQGAGISAGDTNVTVNAGTIADNFGNDAQLSDYTAAIYYIRQPASGEGFSLYRTYAFVNSSSNVATTSEELVEGVENMQLLYGLDRNDDGVAEQYLRADLIANDDWSRVVTVRIGLLVASQDGIRDSQGFDTQVYRVAGTDIGPADSGLDHVYTQDLRKRFVSTMTVGVRNAN